ncbi:MAG: hypothetical protein HY560_09155 [Gemmatimonadetes bacterium]|nr:hypothetical protein [Gemmatimonadota bacterium]
MRCGAIVAITLGWVGEAQAQRAAARDPDGDELASYRLSMAVVNKVAVATRAMVAEAKKDPKYQQLLSVEAEIKAVEAEMKTPAEIEALEAKDELTDAEAAKLEQLREKFDARVEQLQPKLEQLRAKQEKMEEAEDLGEWETLADMERRLLQYPPIAAGLRAAGLTPREYAKFMLAMWQAATVVAFKQQGLLKEMPAGISLENVKFLENHAAELGALQKEWEALGVK